MEPVLGLPGGMEWVIICCITLPVVLLVVGILLIVKKASANSAQQSLRQPSAPAGWHPDPTARHELRYWNGLAWTHSVSDGGEQSEDPL